VDQGVALAITVGQLSRYLSGPRIDVRALSAQRSTERAGAIARDIEPILREAARRLTAWMMVRKRFSGWCRRPRSAALASASSPQVAAFRAAPWIEEAGRELLRSTPKGAIWIFSRPKPQSVPPARIGEMRHRSCC